MIQTYFCLQLQIKLILFRRQHNINHVLMKNIDKIRKISIDFYGNPQYNR
jgi:hypothetical protein